MTIFPPYNPDDARITPASLEFLRTAEGQALLREVTPIAQNPTVADLAQLRKRHPADSLHAGLALAKIQPKAREKFPHAAFFWATPEALEQATSARVAAHKASRFASAGATRIIDACSGIGGDALALAQIAPTFAIDQSETRLTCLRFNAEDHPPLHPLRAITAKIENILEKHSPLPTDAFLHIDPSRRAQGKRSPKYEDLIPPPSMLEKLFTLYPNAALKLSSAVDFESLPMGGGGHLELISENRSVVQAMLWRGQLARLFPQNTRTATILSNTQPPFTFTAIPHEPRTTDHQPHQYLYELDGSLTRSQLAAPFADSLSLIPLTPDAGYLTSDSHHTHPALIPFQVHATLPFSESRVTEALQKIEAPQGPVEVKSRGAPLGIDTDHLQKLWSRTANRRLTVLLFRHAKDTLAAIASRLPQL